MAPRFSEKLPVEMYCRSPREIDEAEERRLQHPDEARRATAVLDIRLALSTRTPEIEAVPGSKPVSEGGRDRIAPSTLVLHLQELAARTALFLDPLYGWRECDITRDFVVHRSTLPFEHVSFEVDE